ncbi:MAG: hypothetical protein AAF799_19330 [Myxococcota bacterium]
MTLLERYLAGEHQEVWEDIYDVAATPEVVADVQAVAAETMRRVRANLEKIVARLEAEEFEFHDPAAALCPPSPKVATLLQEVDDKISRLRVDEFPGRPLPPSVRAFYEIVGSVNLTGVSAKWPDPEAEDDDFDSDTFLSDGLLVAPVEELVLAADEIVENTGCLAFSPDLFTKEDASGGPPYAFYIASPSLDAFCAELDVAFVPYLRWAVLEWGGFPGLRHYENAPEDWLEALKADLDPF